MKTSGLTDRVKPDMLNRLDIQRPILGNDIGSRDSRRAASGRISAMQDKLLLLVGNWFAIKAEGASAILAACFMTAYLGLLSTLVLVARTRSGPKVHQNESSVAASQNTYNIDQPK
jgi:hypothetical protein